MARATHVPELGDVQLQKTYLYYDGPLLFSCRNQEGELSFWAWVDSDDVGYRYMVVKISAARLTAVERDGVAIRDIWLGAEDGQIMVVAFEDGEPYTASSTTFWTPETPELQEWLTDPGVFLSFDGVG